MTEALTELVLFELLTLECSVDEYGILRYYNTQGQLHREYGPAVVYVDGTQVWYQNDQLHRVDGPAIECPDGRRAWWQNGQRHRIDGPAIEYADGSCNWFIDDILLTRAEWQQAVANMERV